MNKLQDITVQARTSIGWPDDMASKLSFLCSAEAHPGVLGPIERIETNLSWIVLSSTRVLKLKKPLKTPWQDYSTLAGREQNCREEVRVNRRLAPDVYLGVLALQITESGRYRLVPEGEAGRGGRIVDWLVQMHRLPGNLMLDHMIASHTVSHQDAARLAGVLVDFYRGAQKSWLTGDQYAGRFASEHEHDKAVLLTASLSLTRAKGVLDQYDAALDQLHGTLLARVRDGHVVDGQGDLRPDHVCLLATPVVIDALEFSDMLRQVDPADELAFFRLECALQDADWFGAQVQARTLAALKDAVPPALLAFYTASRALLRARQCAAHLLRRGRRSPEKWLLLAHRYLACAGQSLVDCRRLHAP